MSEVLSPKPEELEKPAGEAPEVTTEATTPDQAPAVAANEADKPATEPVVAPSVAPTNTEAQPALPAAEAPAAVVAPEPNLGETQPDREEPKPAEVIPAAPEPTVQPTLAEDKPASAHTAPAAHAKSADASVDASDHPHHGGRRKKGFLSRILGGLGF